MNVLRECAERRVIRCQLRLHVNLNPIALRAPVPKVVVLEIVCRLSESVFVGDVVNGVDDVKCIGDSSINVVLHRGSLRGVLNVDEIEAVGRFDGRWGTPVSLKSDGIVSSTWEISMLRGHTLKDGVECCANTHDVSVVLVVPSLFQP